MNINKLTHHWPFNQCGYHNWTNTRGLWLEYTTFKSIIWHTGTLTHTPLYTHNNVSCRLDRNVNVDLLCFVAIPSHSYLLNKQKMRYIITRTPLEHGSRRRAAVHIHRCARIYTRTHTHTYTKYTLRSYKKHTLKIIIFLVNWIVIAFSAIEKKPQQLLCHWLRSYVSNGLDAQEFYSFSICLRCFIYLFCVL